MVFSYFNSDNKLCGFAPIIGGSWNELKQKIKNDTISQLLSQVDMNGDDVIQKEEVSFLKKLLLIADSLVQGSTNDKIIADNEVEVLVEQIKQKTIDKAKLWHETIEESNNIKSNFSNAEDITSKFNCKCLAGYDFQVFKTNCQANHSVKDCQNEIAFNTYVLKFYDKDTNFNQEIKINFSVKYSESQIKSFISQILEQCNKNVVDLMCNELENLYITPHSDSKKDIGSSKQYEKVKGINSPEGVYVPKDESITLFVQRNKFILDTFIHELGHAKDNIGSKYNGINSELFDLITEIRPKKRADEYHLATKKEMYAELFNDYASTLDYMTKQIEKKYKNIIDILPREAKETFIKEFVISYITGQDTTISSILSRAGLSEFKNLFGIILNKSIEIKLPEYYQARTHFEQIKKLAQKNPKILAEFNDVMRKIASDYNNPRDAKKVALL